MAAYTQALRQSGAAPTVRPAVQLRAALLVKTLHRIRFGAYKKRDLAEPLAFLEGTLLNDAGYAAWYRGFAQETDG